jgi:hypothetical protein
MKRTILIGIGGWYLCYYYGFFHYIFKKIGVEKFKNIYFEGVSAGGIVTGPCVATVNGCKNMKHWYNNGPKMMINEKIYNAKTTKTGIYKSAEYLYNKTNDEQRNAIRKYLRVLTTTNELKPYWFSNIRDKDSFIKALIATANIPLVFSLQPIQYKNMSLWDGHLAKMFGIYDYYKMNEKNDDKKLIIAWNSDLISSDRLIVINLYKFYFADIFSAFIPALLNQEFASFTSDIIFKRGYNDAKKNFPKIKEKFEQFFS